MHHSLDLIDYCKKNVEKTSLNACILSMFLKYVSKNKNSLGLGDRLKTLAG